MSLIKPRALKPGAMLGIVAPASVVPPQKLERGVAELERLGFRTRVMPHTLQRGPLHFAGTVAERVADLHTAFLDAEVDAVVCARGGSGAAELLPHLEPALIAAHPKAFVGYSDITSLHVWLQEQAGLVTFHGPMVASDFSRPGGCDGASWRDAIMATEPWSLGPERGLRVLQPGQAAGVLSGGCVSIYVEALGTPFAATARGGVLFLEDVGTKPYQWDRMLVHLRLAGMLEGVAGIVFGDMAQCVEPEEQARLEETLLYSLRDFTGPIGIGLRSGHVDAGNVTLPFGVPVRLDFADAANPTMHFEEASVRG